MMWLVPPRCLLALCLLALLTVPSLAFAEGGTSQTLYQQGVTQYRNGQYEQALKTFGQFVQQVPESQEGQYYYAISLAQLGRYQEAKQAYQNVVKINPTSEAAKLSEEGIAALPSPNQLDRPPQFQSTVGATALSGNPTNAAPANGGMDANAMQMMMMMNSMGGSGGSGGGFNPMMFTMLQNMNRQTPTADGSTPPGDSSTMPPEALSTMMMNQMMNNMDFGGSKKDDE